MSGIFRRPFRMPPPAQSPLAALTGAAAGGGTVQPAHLSSAAELFAPATRGGVAPAAFENAAGFYATALRLALSPGTLDNAQSFYSATLRLALLPEALVNSNAFHDPAVATGATVLPSLFANGQGFYAPVIGVAIAPPSLANSQTYFAASAVRDVAAPAYSNAPSFHGPRLALRISAEAYASAGASYAPAIVQPGVVDAPFVASASQIFAASVSTPFSIEVTATLNVAGWSREPARRSRPRRPTPSWPNLPKVEAPPWRLTVVTPEVARQRARVQMAWRKRAQQLKRKRDVERRIDGIFNELVDQEITRTIVRLIAEDA